MFTCNLTVFIHYTTFAIEGGLKSDKQTSRQTVTVWYFGIFLLFLLLVTGVNTATVSVLVYEIVAVDNIGGHFVLYALRQCHTLFVSFKLL